MVMKEDLIEYSRVTHKKMEASKAKISKTESEDLINYTIKFLSIKRTITIEVENKFPSKTTAWTVDNWRWIINYGSVKSNNNSAILGTKEGSG